MPAPPRAPRRPPIPYEPFAWLVFTALSLLAIVDRFTLNVWPRQLHSIGAGVAAVDLTDGLLPGPWTVKLYDVVARVTGRYSILALNLLLFTTMRSTAALLSETWLARNVLDFANLFDANSRLHRWNGATLAVMTLVHVWTILLPPALSGWKAQVLPGTWEWILSERKPHGFKDADASTETVSLQVDDVFRLVEMTLLLAILLPLSVRWLATRWHLGIHVHRFIAVIYFVDIVRRHTHPHSWILNTPVFLLWLLDHLVSAFWRRNTPAMRRVVLSDDYMLLLWHQPQRSDTVGPKYYLRLIDSSFLEPAHVFTGFENRRGLSLADGAPWSACLLVRTYHRLRRPQLGRRDGQSHTARVAEAMWGIRVRTWGPFHGSMSEACRAALDGPGPVTLVAGGSAAAYVLDAVQRLGAGGGAGVTVLYSCRDAALLAWVADVLGQLVEKGGCGGMQAVLAVTDGGRVAAEKGVAEEAVRERQGRIEERERSFTSSGEEGRAASVRVQHGRINFVKEVPEGNTVFFQGSGGLQRCVAEACKVKGSRFVAGPAFDQDVAKRRGLLQRLVGRCTSGEDGEV